MSYPLDFYTNELPLQFGGLQPGVTKNQDPHIERDLHLSLDDLFHGCSKKIKISRRVCAHAVTRTAFFHPDSRPSHPELVCSTGYEQGWLHVQYQRQDPDGRGESWMERRHKNHFSQRGRPGKIRSRETLVFWFSMWISFVKFITFWLKFSM